MTPTELADWLDSLAETDMNAGTLSTAAATLREANRLLTYPHLTGSYDVYWYKDVSKWLAGDA